MIPTTELRLTILLGFNGDLDDIADGCLINADHSSGVADMCFINDGCLIGGMADCCKITDKSLGIADGWSSIDDDG